jgi:hypothetical protein
VSVWVSVWYKCVWGLGVGGHGGGVGWGCSIWGWLVGVCARARAHASTQSHMCTVTSEHSIF